MLLAGLYIPLTAPFQPDGRLALHKLAANVARYSKTAAAGLIVLGPWAEPTLLSDDETRDLLHTAAEAAAPEKVLIAGIARDSVAATLTLAAYAADQNYDSVLMGPPSLALTDSEQLTWFQTIADRSPLPVLLLSPATRALSLDAVARLAAHTNILGLLTAEPAAAIAEILTPTAQIRREVTVTPTFAAVTTRMQLAAATVLGSNVLIPAGSLTRAATVFAEPTPLAAPLLTRSKIVGFQVLSTSTASLLDNLSAGAIGIAPAFAAAAPQACYEVFAAWKDSDQPLAQEKQSRLIAAAALAEFSPGTLKFACDLNGYYGGPPRLPYLPPTAAGRTALEQNMKPLNN